ncbi:MAG: tetratricopeptide repeat protein [Leptospiraceae bacterium]|nr:tetratricopeptide repeat protein [Leptospiraceae bacterium]
MADTETGDSRNEQIEDLLSDLDRDLTEVISPMEDQFKEDLMEVRGEDPDLQSIEEDMASGDDGPDADYGDLDSDSGAGFDDSEESLDLGDFGDSGDATSAGGSQEEADPFSGLDMGETSGLDDTASADTGLEDALSGLDFGGGDTAETRDFGESIETADAMQESGGGEGFSDLDDLMGGLGDESPADSGFDLGEDFATEESSTNDSAGGGDFDMDLGDLGDMGAETGGGSEPAFEDLTEPLEGDQGDTQDAASVSGAEATGDAGADPFADLGDFGGAETQEDPFADTGLSLQGDPFADASSEGDMDLGDMGLGDDGLSGGDLGSLDDGSSSGGGDFDIGLSDMDMGLDSSGDSASGGESEASSAAAGEEDLGGLEDLGSFSSGDLEEMANEAQMSAGIGEEFTDEELATIRTEIVDFPQALRKAIIDAVVNEKLSHPDQRMLMNMIVDQADPDQIADFLEPRMGFRPDTSPPDVRKDGVPIIYADEFSPEALGRRRRRAKMMLLGLGGIVLGVLGVFGGLLLYRSLSIQGLYEAGLERLHEARRATPDEKAALAQQAEEYFQRALQSDDGVYDVEYLNRYGIAYLKAGYYDQAFYKLFGKINPEYEWNDPSFRAPLINVAENSRWYGPAERKEGYQTTFVDESGTPRKVEIPGAYIVARLRDGEMDRENLMSLGRFHSHNSRKFLSTDEGKKYKNDELGIDYYRLITTQLNRPDDAEALAGIGKIHYNRKEYGAAARKYNEILEKHPAQIEGHAGLINTYIELWKEDGDPRFVIARHREARRLGLEEELPIYVLTKLAGFYIDLDPTDLRIKYQVDPVDAVSGYDLDQNVVHLLKIVFNKEEKRDEEVVKGSEYGEGFYQRGRYLLSRNESARALRQFENAVRTDPWHYPALMEMGEYYQSVLDFSRAEEYYTAALQTYEAHRPDYGNRPEDETLMDGDIGKIYYNIGSLLYLQNAGGSDPTLIPRSRIYPFRAESAESEEVARRRQQLSQAAEYFDTALDSDLQDSEAIVRAHYRKGWIRYMNGDFDSALQEWTKLDSSYDAVHEDRSILMGRANAAFHEDQLSYSMGNYLKLKDDLETESVRIANPDPQNRKHRLVYEQLTQVYNNLGAVYEKQYMEKKEAGASRSVLENLQEQAMSHYWKAVETAGRIDLPAEIPRQNIQLGFPRGGQREPLLDEWLNPMLEEVNNDI